MLIWLNGTFGAGKSTTAELLAKRIEGTGIFDAELVGYTLRTISTMPSMGDFQHWPPWRRLVVETAVGVLGYVEGTLVVPQTVLVEQYWNEIRAGLAEADVPVLHVVLHARRDALQDRIMNDRADNRQWRLEHLPEYEAAISSWLGSAATVVDTTTLAPDQVADAIAAMSR